MSKKLLPVFSSRGFIVSGLKFISLIYSEFIFVCERKWSTFIVLRVAPVPFIGKTVVFYLLFLLLFYPFYIFASLTRPCLYSERNRMVLVTFFSFTSKEKAPLWLSEALNRGTPEAFWFPSKQEQNLSVAAYGRTR